MYHDVPDVFLAMNAGSCTEIAIAYLIFLMCLHQDACMRSQLLLKIEVVTHESHPTICPTTDQLPQQDDIICDYFFQVCKSTHAFLFVKVDCELLLQFIILVCCIQHLCSANPTRYAVDAFRNTCLSLRFLNIFF